MTTDFLQVADSLRDELQHFFRIVRQTADTTARQAAATQLQTVINKVEPFAYGPEEEQWRVTPEPQRWGYLRLVSYVGTAQHELRQLQRAAGRVHERDLTSRGRRDEPRHARGISRREPRTVHFAQSRRDEKQ